MNMALILLSLLLLLLTLLVLTLLFCLSLLQWAFLLPQLIFSFSIYIFIHIYIYIFSADLYFTMEILCNIAKHNNLPEFSN